MRIQNFNPANVRISNRPAGSPYNPGPGPEPQGSSLDRWSRAATLTLIYSSVPLGGAILGGMVGGGVDALLKTADYTATYVGLATGFALGVAELCHLAMQPPKPPM